LNCVEFSWSLGWRFVLITRLQSTIAIYLVSNCFSLLLFKCDDSPRKSHESCFYLLHIDADDADDDDDVDEERKCEVTRQRDHNIVCYFFLFLYFLFNKRFVCLIESSKQQQILLWPTRALKMQFIFEKTMPNEWNNVLIKTPPVQSQRLVRNCLLLLLLLLLCDKTLKAIS